MFGFAWNTEFLEQSIYYRILAECSTFSTKQQQHNLKEKANHLTVQLHTQQLRSIKISRADTSSVATIINFITVLNLH
jgi:hypothetical protein